MKLSICMMIKNEEKNLDRCLSSLEPLMSNMESELIIIDTGSTDNSISISQKYTNKIYSHKWNNDFSSMRNTTINYAQGEWIFIVDADEELTNQEKLIDLLKSDSISNVNTIFIWCKSYINYKVEDTAVVIISPRLFRKNTIRYEGRVHNQPQFEKPAGYIDVILNHYGYIVNDKELMEKKFKRTVELLTLELNEDPNNVYYRYQLANSYSMHGDKIKAANEISKAYNIILEKSLSLEKYKYVIYEKASGETSLENWNEVVEVCKKGIEAVREYVDLYFLMAQALEKLHRYEESMHYYQNYLELLNNFDNLEIKLDSSIQFYTLNLKERAIFNIIVLCRKVNKDYETIRYIMMLNDKKLLLEAAEVLILLSIEEQRYTLIKDFYDKKIENNDEYIKNEFYTILERTIFKIEDKYLISEIFSEYNNSYGQLNNIRTLYINNSKNIKKDINQFVNNYDLGATPDYYGDIIYYMIKYNIPIEKVFSKHTEKNVLKKLKYCAEKYNDFLVFLKNSFTFNNEKNLDFSLIRTNKIIGRVILLLDKDLKGEEYRIIFNNYIDYGVIYIQSIYNKAVLDTEMILDLKDAEEIFLLYINKAKEQKSKNQSEYLRYLKKALENYPEMKNGIELLLNEIKIEYTNNKNELVEYCNKIKTTIKTLIEIDNLKEAEELINEYEKIISNDLDIVLFKSQLSIKKIK